MAEERKAINFPFVRKLVAGVALLAFLVIFLGGILAGTSMVTIVYRAFFVMVVTKLVGAVIIKTLVNYEEISRGEG